MAAVERLLMLLTVIALLGILYTADKHLPGWQADALPTVDRVVVDKASRLIYLLKEGATVRHYRMGLGFAPEGDKTREGDGRTPEGLYRLDWRNPNSRYHLSLHVSYPNAADRAAAEARGESPGGAIMIHGLPNGMGWLPWKYRGKDWTLGCMAVTNREMEEIYHAVPDGTPIEIHQGPIVLSP
uniref:L,D-TPase catalytic domain-containing protein n=1 Tax=Magnetococcus massalia (strain MO-1) TaxID=451514 RepID=A0A1S7LC82_MAGMO|nr:conserved protein of unknown function [Candidatus Magnetococcus massalia]